MPISDRDNIHFLSYERVSLDLAIICSCQKHRGPQKPEKISSNTKLSGDMVYLIVLFDVSVFHDIIKEWVQK